MFSIGTDYEMDDFGATRRVTFRRLRGSRKRPRKLSYAQQKRLGAMISRKLEAGEALSPKLASLAQSLLRMDNGRKRKVLRLKKYLAMARRDGKLSVRRKNRLKRYQRLSKRGRLRMVLSYKARRKLAAMPSPRGARG